jgi:hypothetical protein
MAPLKKSSFIDDLGRWLGENADRLPVSVVPTPGREGHKLEYRLRGVPSLRVWASARTCRGPLGDREEITLEVAAMYRRECVDLLVDFDAVIERTARGNYYCALCKDTGNAWYTNDRLALLRSHCFERLAVWCREKIREDRLLVIERDGGFTAAHIFDGRELRAKWSKLIPGFVITSLWAEPDPVMTSSGHTPGETAKARSRSSSRTITSVSRSQ